MSEVRTDTPPAHSQDRVPQGEAPDSEGHGKHRGPAAPDDATTEPHGKHRKPGAR
ncbi:hypothetical protein [Streptomyces sp. NPDC058953]|uniref:hypothetical protein n=1 Tax=unclassified Streptomyces TaxID=2593676 RepID=UPI0036A715CC